MTEEVGTYRGETNERALARTEKGNGLATTQSGQLDLLDADCFQRALDLAKVMAEADGFVPPHLHGKPGACLGVIALAHTWGMNPFLVMGAMAEVHGKLLPEGKLVQAAIETSTSVLGRISFEHYGDWDRVQGQFRLVDSRTKKDAAGRPAQYPVPAWKDADEDALGVTVSGKLATGDVATLDVPLRSCHPRNSTLWATDPQQQIIYAATRKWARRHTPHIMMGVYTPDEMGGSVIDVTPSEPGHAQGNGAKKDEVRSKLDKARAAVDAEREKTERAEAARTQAAADSEKRTAPPASDASDAQPERNGAGPVPSVADIWRVFKAPKETVVDFMKHRGKISGSLAELDDDTRKWICANPERCQREIRAWLEAQDADAQAAAADSEKGAE